MWLVIQLVSACIQREKIQVVNWSEPNDGEKFSEFEPTNERTHRKERKKRISHPYICLDIKSVWFFVRRKTSFSLCDRERMGERMRMRQRNCVCALAFVHVCSCVWVCRIEYCFDVREIEKRWQKFYMLIWQCIVIWSCVCCVCVWVLNSALKLYAIESNGCVCVGVRGKRIIALTFV